MGSKPLCVITQLKEVNDASSKIKDLPHRWQMTNGRRRIRLLHYNNHPLPVFRQTDP